MTAFIRLVDFNSSEEKEKEFFNQKNKFSINTQDDFFKIPGSPIAYWVSEKVRHIFLKSETIGKIADVKVGMHTGNNDLFLRLWFEIEIIKMGLNIQNQGTLNESEYKWLPYNKGGEYRKWYGNNNFMVNWYKNGVDIHKYNNVPMTYRGAPVRAKEYFFRKNLTWSFVSSSSFGVRYTPEGFIFDVGGSSLFPKEIQLLNYISAFLCCNIAFTFLKTVNPTMNFQVENIKSLPIIFPKNQETRQKIDKLAQQNIDISCEEWDSRETSWDFKKNELLSHKTSGRLKDAYNNYCSYWKDKFQKLHANEEELNLIFIDIYDLADELTPDVPLKDVTILKDESEIKDGKLVFEREVIIKQFISYAVGCIFGRYSPDKPGLILANQGETIHDFREMVPDASFMPDEDNIIPILEAEYFQDDIVSRFREFLKLTFGKESLAENLEFIAGALSKSKKGESPEKVIRDYFLKSFFKDHVKMYKKRPIYWLFTSGKGKGFNALVYMHRYDKETLAKMRTDYLLKLEDKLDARMGMLGDSAGDKQERSKLNKQIEELAKYDEVLNNKALEYIDIDLDDGVKVNYAKFEGLVGKI